MKSYKKNKEEVGYQRITYTITKSNVPKTPPKPDIIMLSRLIGIYTPGKMLIIPKSIHPNAK